MTPSKGSLLSISFTWALAHLTWQRLKCRQGSWVDLKWEKGSLQCGLIGVCVYGEVKSWLKR